MLRVRVLPFWRISCLILARDFFSSKKNDNAVVDGSFNFKTIWHDFCFCFPASYGFLHVTSTQTFTASEIPDTGKLQ